MSDESQVGNEGAKEGEGQNLESQGKEGNSGEGQGKKLTKNDDGGKLYTQAELDAIMAKDRKSQKREAESTKKAYEQLRSQTESLLSGRQSFDEVKEDMEETAAKLRTAEEELANRELAYTNKLKAAQEQATVSDQKYRDLKISLEIARAADPIKSAMECSGDLIRHDPVAPPGRELDAENAEIRAVGQRVLQGIARDRSRLDDQSARIG